jgi:HlyD family secretion protein
MPTLLLLAPLGLVASCSEPPPEPVYQALAVERRDIVVSVEAAGSVEPEIAVEVKSKAAGEILEMRVDTGDRVEQGALLIRIDPRQPRNIVAQAEAEREVAVAGLANAESQKRRSDELYRAQSISETEHDQAVLDLATARAELVRARVALENARIALEDTEVRAPISGTVIEKHVERGQVISSPTQDVAGGTLLMRMADLGRVQVRTLVDETDIGKIRAGLSASVVAAAYPDREFHAEVEKIEPQAVTEQNVTMFPVLVSVENPEGRLRPGMNCEVEVQVGSREGVLVVPNAALRTSRDVGSAAAVLGIEEQEVQLALETAAKLLAQPESASQERPPGDGSGGPEIRNKRYIVFVLRQDGPRATLIRTGLTDLAYSEVLEGLEESDSVLVLPSAGLVRSQERFRERIGRITGDGLPGVKSSKP